MRDYRHGVWAGLLGVVMAVGGARGGWAQPPLPDPPVQDAADDDLVSINFDGADLREVINAISRMTGENFLIDPAVKGTVTIVAPRRVPRKQAFQVLQAILELHGFALVPGENAYKVVQARTAAQKDIPVCVGRDPCDGYTQDQLVTQLIPLRYAEAQGLTGILQSLVSRDSNMVAHPNTNTIIMTDSSANIRRILRIVNQIDVSGYQENITIIGLKHSRAEQMAQTLREALEPVGAQVSQRRPRRAGQPPEASVAGRPSEVKIIPEIRTNALIIVANEIDTQQVMFLIRELDTQTPVEQNNIHVYHLSNALATEMADVLTNLASATPPAEGGEGTPADRVRTFYQEVSVVADEATNALLLIASPQDYLVMERIIEQLDVRRPQVLVEVLIAEVSLDFARNLGIRWAAGVSSGRSDGAFAGVNQAQSSSALGNLSNPALPTPLDLTNVAAVTTAIPAALPTGGTIGALAFDMGVLQLFIEANANETDSDFNILSSPNLLMLDNEEAQIIIADNVPFVTGTLTDATSLNQNQTFEFRDVGITLEVTPHIAPDRTVRLELHQEVNEVGPEVSVGQQGTTTLTEIKREVTTVVLVNDSHTIVIGGLITESERDTVSKVPVLGNIPVLGWLFKNKSRTTSKKNLMVFITPTIVSDLGDSERVTQEKVQELPEETVNRVEQTGSYRRSRTFQREFRTLPSAAGPGDVSEADPGASGLIDAPVK